MVLISLVLSSVRWLALVLDELNLLERIGSGNCLWKNAVFKSQIKIMCTELAQVVLLGDVDWWSWVISWCWRKVHKFHKLELRLCGDPRAGKGPSLCWPSTQQTQKVKVKQIPLSCSANYGHFFSVNVLWWPCRWSGQGCSSILLIALLLWFRSLYVNTTIYRPQHIQPF